MTLALALAAMLVVGVALGDVVGLDVEAHGAASALHRTADLGVKLKLDAHIKGTASGAASLVGGAFADLAVRLGAHIELNGKVNDTRLQRRGLGLSLAVDVDNSLLLALGRVAILDFGHDFFKYKLTFYFIDNQFL
jgi:hypothetical protein